MKSKSTAQKHQLVKELREAEAQIKQGETVSWEDIKRRYRKMLRAGRKKPLSALRGFVKGIKASSIREKRDRL